MFALVESRSPAPKKRDDSERERVVVLAAFRPPAPLPVDPMLDCYQPQSTSGSASDWGFTGSVAVVSTGSLAAIEVESLPG